ncbi:MAG: hypothetical protein AB8B61_07910, partial [Cyclobacteriaceae bacterium]
MAFAFLSACNTEELDKLSDASLEPITSDWIFNIGSATYSADSLLTDLEEELGDGGLSITSEGAGFAFFYRDTLSFANDEELIELDNVNQTIDVQAI